MSGDPVGNCRPGLQFTESVLGNVLSYGWEECVIRQQWLKLCGAIILLSGVVRGQEPFFIQMSDPQFGMYTNNVGFKQETANLEFAIATANRLHPAFIVITGDLTNKPGDAAQIAEYLRVTHEIDPQIPVYNVAGNHDVGNIPTHESLVPWPLECVV
jgi:serine/threonine-protein phosphatase CPPED1